MNVRPKDLDMTSEWPNEHKHQRPDDNDCDVRLREEPMSDAKFARTMMIDGTTVLVASELRHLFQYTGIAQYLEAFGDNNSPNFKCKAANIKHQTNSMYYPSIMHVESSPNVILRT